MALKSCVSESGKPEMADIGMKFWDLWYVSISESEELSGEGVEELFEEMVMIGKQSSSVAPPRKYMLSLECNMKVAEKLLSQLTVRLGRKDSLKREYDAALQRFADTGMADPVTAAQPANLSEPEEKKAYSGLSIIRDIKRFSSLQLTIASMLRFILRTRRESIDSGHVCALEKERA